MPCDDCPKPETVLLVESRPSDRSEIVSVMGLCDEHAAKVFVSNQIARTGEQVAMLFEGNLGGALAATPAALEDYIESPAAARNHHTFLTI